MGLVRRPPTLKSAPRDVMWRQIVLSRKARFGNTAKGGIAAVRALTICFGVALRALDPEAYNETQVNTGEQVRMHFKAQVSLLVPDNMCVQMRCCIMVCPVDLLVFALPDFLYSPVCSNQADMVCPTVTTFCLIKSAWHCLLLATNFLRDMTHLFEAQEPLSDVGHSRLCAAWYGVRVVCVPLFRRCLGLDLASSLLGQSCWGS